MRTSGLADRKWDPGLGNREESIRSLLKLASWRVIADLRRSVKLGLVPQRVSTRLPEFVEACRRVVYSQTSARFRLNSMPRTLTVLVTRCRTSSSFGTILFTWIAFLFIPTIAAENVDPARLPEIADRAQSAASSPSSPVRLPAVDSIIQQAIADNNIPGAVLVVGHNGKAVYRKAYGHRSLEPRREPMTLDTVFDLASLTKVIATTTSVMQLVELGKVRLNDPVAKYIPEFAQNGKDDITIRQLLTHFSGLAPDLDLEAAWEGKQTAYQLATVMPPETTPGSGFVYSDINFIILGELVEKISGDTLDVYTARHIFTPLKMTHTRFLPPTAWRPRIAPTQYDENEKMLRGIVHDPTARRMGGVAGHAGLFGTGDDLAKFAQTLLDGGDGILSADAVRKMTSPESPPSAPVLRGFGWDIDSPFSSSRGDFLPVGSYGHTGFTGTSMWIDPTTQTYIVLLTNAVHPRGKGNAIALRAKVATEVAAALNLSADQKEAVRWKSITGYNEALTAARHVSVRNGSVKTGIDVLEEHAFDLLKLPPDSPAGAKKHIGLLTNQTGVDASGKRTIDVLAQVPGVSLDAIFSPEHGVTGTLDTTDINNSKDAATGVPVYSVYGATDSARRRPKCCARWTQLYTTFRMRVFVSIPTKRPLGIFSKQRQALGSRSSCWIAPTQLPAHSCRGRQPIRDTRASPITGPCPCVTA